VANGRRRKRRTRSTFSHFSPNKFYLNFDFFFWF
jgi:hypothetical protein